MAKEVLELAVLKAQVSAQLSNDEIMELLDIDMGALMSEHGLDLMQAEQVMVWRKQEALRLQHELVSSTMATHRQLEESVNSVTGNQLTRDRLRELIKEELEGYN